MNFIESSCRLGEFSGSPTGNPFRGFLPREKLLAGKSNSGAYQTTMFPEEESNNSILFKKVFTNGPSEHFEQYQSL